MGKQVSRQSSTVAKISKKDQKCHFQRLIKVLKPKVYITESFNFKSLVQELTGNGGSSASTLHPPVESKVTAQEGLIPSINKNNIFSDQTQNQCQYQSSSNSSSSSNISTVEVSLASYDNILSDHRGYLQTGHQIQTSMEVSDSAYAYIYSPDSRYPGSTSDQDCDISNLQYYADDTAQQEYFMANELLYLFHLNNGERSSVHNCFSHIEEDISIYDYL